MPLNRPVQLDRSDVLCVSPDTHVTFLPWVGSPITLGPRPRLDESPAGALDLARSSDPFR